jgi:hypothetical protein
VGTSVQVARAGAQLQLRDNVVDTVAGNVGNAFDTWPAGVHRSQYIGGAGVIVKTMLAPGPLSLAVSTHSWRATPIVELSFGATF